MAEVALEPQVGVPGQGPDHVAGRSPWELGWRRLRRNRLALASLALFIVIAVISFAAPLYADHVAHTDPFDNNLTGKPIVNGKKGDIMQQGGGVLLLGVNPIGPTWDVHHYFLGADQQGRDVAARLLYGGRNSLLIGAAAAAITCFLGTIFGVISGFFGGAIDGVLSRALDIVWAFPVYLLAISLSTVLIARGVSWGPFHLTSSSLLLPIFIIGLVYVPYVSRPIRGEVISLRRREFVEAAIGLGASDWRLLWSDVLPNIITTTIVFFPLMLAIAMLTEAALSFLSIGVQAPNASWGTVILDGQELLYTRPTVALAPGIAIARAVAARSGLGDGIRAALEPRAKLRSAE